MHSIDFLQRRVLSDSRLACNTYKISPSCDVVMSAANWPLAVHIAMFAGALSLPTRIVSRRLVMMRVERLTS